MFQYAAGLALANHHKTTLKLDVSWFDKPEKQEGHEKYGLGCFHICEQFATEQECSAFFPKNLTRGERWALAAKKLLRIRNCTKTFEQTGAAYFQRDWGYDPLFWDLPLNTHLDGYFQNQSFFEPIEKELRSHFSFRYPPTEKVLRMADKIQSSSPSVFMHFRRQDYVGTNSIYGPLAVNYYLQSLKALKERIGSFTVFIFSDDIDSVERDLKLEMPCHFVRATEKHNFFDKLRLMSLCDHGIISNSTFAWWGAWLNPSKEKIILAPKPWHADIDPQFRSLKPVPLTWVQIDRNPQAPLAAAE